MIQRVTKDRNHQPQSQQCLQKTRRKESKFIKLLSLRKESYGDFLSRPAIPQVETTPIPHKNPVGRPRIHPIKTPTSRPPKTPVTMPVGPDSDDSDDNDEIDVPGKKSKTNPRNNQKSLNSKPSNKNSNYNNIMLIKNEQIVSNSSSLRQLKAQYHLASSLNSKALTPVTHQQLMLDEASMTSAAERQQQNPSSTSTPLGVSDRMSKEKQKFFRFSVFNSERKAKSVDGHAGQLSKSSLKSNKSKNNNNNHKVTTNGIGTNDASAATYDKYKFVSSSDSEHDRDTICDKTKVKAKGKSVSVGKPETGRKANHERTAKVKTKKDKDKSRQKQSGLHPNSDDSSCCSSEGEDSGSSSDSSTSSSGTSSSSSGSSSSANSSCSSTGEGNQNSPSKASLANKAESINTMNVFACINSRELNSQTKRPPYCWTSMPFAKNQQSESLFKKQSTKSKSFGANSRSENEVWGFAAEAKKSLNIFTNSDSESRTHRMSNFSGTESDCQMSLLSLSSTNARNRISRSDRDAGSSRFTNQMPLLAPHLRKDLLSNNRTATLMRNNTIMSSDDDARQLSPSKMFRKAVHYKKFDNNTLNNKKLIMDTSLNGAKYGCDDRPVKEPASNAGPVEPTSEPTPKQSQPPYNNNTNNQSDMGKKLTTLRL